MSRVIHIRSMDEWNQFCRDGYTVVVDFTADWCGPCRAMSPFFKDLSCYYEGLLFLEINVDEMEELAAECAISAMPTFQVWRNGEKAEEMLGADRSKLKALVEKYAELN